MKFISKYRNMVYIVRPTQRIIIPGQGINLTPGLRAQFKGRHSIFDSEADQEKFGWTADERLQVEKKLLGHEDFGNSLALAPGEQLTEEQWAMARVKPTVKKLRCMQIGVVRGEIVQCDNEPLLGKDFCADHDPDQPRIIKGAVQQK